MSESNNENYPVDDRPSDYEPFPLPGEPEPLSPIPERQNDLLENPAEEAETEDDEAIY